MKGWQPLLPLVSSHSSHPQCTKREREREIIRGLWSFKIIFHSLPGWTRCWVCVMLLVFPPVNSGSSWLITGCCCQYLAALRQRVCFHGTYSNPCEQSERYGGIGAFRPASPSNRATLLANERLCHSCVCLKKRLLLTFHTQLLVWKKTKQKKETKETAYSKSRPQKAALEVATGDCWLTFRGLHYPEKSREGAPVDGSDMHCFEQRVLKSKGMRVLLQDLKNPLRSKWNQISFSFFF